MSQTELLEKPLTPDVRVILQMFENHRGVDVTLDFDDLCQWYHSIYLEPRKRPKTSWPKTRVARALDAAVQAGYVEREKPWQKWHITQAGQVARRDETVRRMKGEAA